MRGPSKERDDRAFDCRGGVYASYWSMCLRRRACVRFFGSASASLEQGQADASRAITDGGVFAEGWSGKIDANEEKAGLTLSNAKLTQEGGALKATTGPAVTYWNPKNVATGSYTVKATFNEPKYMNLNSHPHPYGIVVAGNDMGTPQATYLYCAAYGKRHLHRARLWS